MTRRVGDTDFGRESSRRVCVGDVVLVRFDDDDEQRLRIVDRHVATDASSDVETTSTDAPLGSALLGRLPGEVCTVEVQTNSFKVELVAVECPPTDRS